MTGGQIIQTVVEILLVVTVFVVIIKRDKLAAWEEKLLCKIRRKRNIKRKK